MERSERDTKRLIQVQDILHPHQFHQKVMKSLDLCNLIASEFANHCYIGGNGDERIFMEKLTRIYNVLINEMLKSFLFYFEKKSDTLELQEPEPIESPLISHQNLSASPKPTRQRAVSTNSAEPEKYSSSNHIIKAYASTPMIKTVPKLSQNDLVPPLHEEETSGAATPVIEKKLDDDDPDQEIDYLLKRKEILERVQATGSVTHLKGILRGLANSKQRIAKFKEEFKDVSDDEDNIDFNAMQDTFVGAYAGAQLKTANRVLKYVQKNEMKRRNGIMEEAQQTSVGTDPDYELLEAEKRFLLKDKDEEYKKLVYTRETENKSLKERVAELTEKLASTTQELLVFQAKSADANVSSMGFERQIRELKRANMSLEEKIDRKKEKIKDLKEQLNCYTSEAKGKGSQLDVLVTRNNKLGEEIKRLRNMLEEAKKGIEDLKARLEQQNEEKLKIIREKDLVAKDRDTLAQKILNHQCSVSKEDGMGEIQYNLHHGITLGIPKEVEFKEEHSTVASKSRRPSGMSTIKEIPKHEAVVSQNTKGHVVEQKSRPQQQVQEVRKQHLGVKEEKKRKESDHAIVSQNQQVQHSQKKEESKEGRKDEKKERKLEEKKEVKEIKETIEIKEGKIEKRSESIERNTPGQEKKDLITAATHNLSQNTEKTVKVVIEKPAKVIAKSEKEPQKSQEIVRSKPAKIHQNAEQVLPKTEVNEQNYEEFKDTQSAEFVDPIRDNQMSQELQETTENFPEDVQQTYEYRQNEYQLPTNEQENSEQRMTSQESSRLDDQVASYGAPENRVKPVEKIEKEAQTQQSNCLMIELGDDPQHASPSTKISAFLNAANLSLQNLQNFLAEYIQFDNSPDSPTSKPFEPIRAQMRKSQSMTAIRNPHNEILAKVLGKQNNETEANKPRASIILNKQGNKKNISLGTSEVGDSKIIGSDMHTGLNSTLSSAHHDFARTGGFRSVMRPTKTPIEKIYEPNYLSESQGTLPTSTTSFAGQGLTSPRLRHRGLSTKIRGSYDGRVISDREEMPSSVRQKKSLASPFRSNYPKGSTDYQSITTNLSTSFSQKDLHTAEMKTQTNYFKPETSHHGGSSLIMKQQNQLENLIKQQQKEAGAGEPKGYQQELEEAYEQIKIKEEKELEDMYSALQQKALVMPNVKKIFTNMVQKKNPNINLQDLEEGNFEVDFEVFKEHMVNFKETHRRCGEDCPHLRRFYEKVGYNTKAKKREFFSLRVTDIDKLPRIIHKIKI